MNANKFVLFLSILCLITFTNIAGPRKKNGNNATPENKDTITAIKDTIKKEAPKKEPFKAIKDITEKCKKYDGLFPVYQDTVSGKTYLEISEDKIGKEYIYFAYVMDGIIDAGYARGSYKDNFIFKVNRYFDRIDFNIQNTSFYFDSTNALAKAQKANINQPLFYSDKIAASSYDDKSKKRSYLIESDNLFFGEYFTQVKPSKSPTDRPDAFNMGSLNNKKSKYLDIKDFPLNTNIAVEYIYDNASPINYGGDEVTDARYVSVKMQHSIIEMPDDKYKPRRDDPRVGYFMEKVNDQTAADATPWKDVIHRWRLEKKNPDAALSDPVKPIVWWIENTTPLTFRPIIKQAVLSWNKAFERAGFSNAVECYEQPDTASWNAEDVRYNVLRWVSSPRPPYGGYGPHLSNPRTGEIISADIMLEFIYLTNRLPYEKLYDVAALDNYLPGSSAQLNGIDYCSFGEGMHQNIMSGMQMLDAFAFSDIDKDEFMKQALLDLVMHEIGHTFGLNHNFIGSNWHTLDEVKNKNYDEIKGLTASVMDYTIPNISIDKNKQGLYFDNQPGEYDKWAIAYGYTQMADKNMEQKELDKILSKSIDPEHRFMNDADDMRYVGRGIDPRCNLYDMSNDAIGYAVENMEMVNKTLNGLLKKYSTTGKSYHELRNAYLTLTGNYNRSLNVVNRYIGGVYINRNMVGQDSLSKPYIPVSLADQKRAMQTLVKYAFAVNAFKTPQDLYNYLQQQRRGNERKENEDPKIHDRILNIQKSILDELLNGAVMQRLIDTKLYGNTYSLNMMLEDLTNGIFTEDLNSAVSSLRQNLQIEYVNRILAVMDNKSAYANNIKSAAFGEADKIKTWMKMNPGIDASTKSHRKYIGFLIDKAMKLD